MRDSKTVEQRLQLLEARQEINEVLHRYARGWDRLDEAAIRSCFHPDATHQHGGFEGASSEFISLGLTAVRDLPSVFHMITNVSIEIVADKAVSECYFLAYQRQSGDVPAEEKDWFLLGRYVDRFECRDGVWKISHRIGLHDGSRTFAPADTSFNDTPADQLSRRSADDPWYRLSEQLRAG